MSATKKIVVALLLLVAATITGSIIYFCISYPYETLVWFYGSTSLVVALLVGIKGTRVWKGKVPPGPDHLFLMMSRSLTHDKRLVRARMLGGLWLDAIASGLLFPELVIRIVRLARSFKRWDGRTSLLRSGAVLTLEGVEIHQSIVAVILAAIVASTWQAREALFYSEIAIWCVVSIPISKLLASAIAWSSLQSQLRKQLGIPYLRFLLIAAMMAVVMVLGYSSLLARDESVPLSAPLVTRVLMAMLTFDSLRALFDGRSSSTIDYMICASGALFYFTVAKTLLRYGDFRRTSADVVSIARNLTVLGKYTEALSELNALKEVTPEILITRAAALLGLKRIDDALRLVCEARVLAKSGDKLDSYQGLIMIAIRHVIPAKTMIGVLTRWLDSNPDPCQLADVLGGAKPLLGLSNCEIDGLIGTPQLIQRPLHTALLQMQLNNRSEAHDLLIHFRPGTEAEEILRLLLLLPSQILPTTTVEEDLVNASKWMDENLVVVEALTKEVHAPGLGVVLALVTMNLQILRDMGSERVQELNYFRDCLRQRMKVEEPGLVVSFHDEMERQFAT